MDNIILEEKEELEMKHYVVTGGCGFIGSHLVECLAVDNYVTVIDDLSVGKIENFGSVREQFPDNVRFLRGSITDLSFLQGAMKSVNGIFHHAALASVPESIADPIKSHDVNATGTLNVLMAARNNDVKVVFASSSAVYGDAAQIPIDESSPPCPLSPYAVQKHLGEEYCTVFTELYGLATVCLRYFNVYGPRQNPYSAYAAVIPKFIDAVRYSASPVIYGDGTQTRDFVHVSDVVRANIMAMESSETGIYNVAGGSATTIKQLAEIVCSAFGCDVDPEYVPARKGDILHSSADISRARDVFGWKPQISVEEGVTCLCGMNS